MSYAGTRFCLLPCGLSESFSWPWADTPSLGALYVPWLCARSSRPWQVRCKTAAEGQLQHGHLTNKSSRSRPFLFYRVFRIIWKVLQTPRGDAVRTAGGSLDQPGDRSAFLPCPRCPPRPGPASVSLLRPSDSPSESLEHTLLNSLANPWFLELLRWGLLLHYAVCIIILSRLARHSLPLKIRACVLLESLWKWQSHCKWRHLQWWHLLSGPEPRAFASWLRVVSDSDAMPRKRAMPSASLSLPILKAVPIFPT